MIAKFIPFAFVMDPVTVTVNVPGNVGVDQAIILSSGVKVMKFVF